MTSIDKDSHFDVALGKQVQSTRHTIPIVVFSKTGRQNYEKVHISEEHSRVGKLGRESPIGGPIYTLPSTLENRSISFGKAKRDITTLKRTSMKNRPGEFFAPMIEDKDDIPSNDALDIIPDNQRFKYRKDPVCIIGTEPKFKLKEAELIANNQVAFYAKDSPGPAAIGGEFGPNHGPTQKNYGDAGKFAQAKRVAEKPKGDNPPEVGPGRHDRRDVALGPQYLSHRRNQPCNEFGRAPKFPKERVTDTICQLDAAKSSLGKQVLNKNRSAPSVGFSCDDRDKRNRTKLCMTRLDEGAKAHMPKFRASQPMLPMEKTIRMSGFG